MVSKLNYNLNWGEYFKLDDASPSGLVRIKNKVGKDIKAYNVGYKLFKKNGDSHTWLLSFRNIHFSIHRIIWVLMHGSINPDLVIDHLDGNPFNNKLDNLSLKSKKDNSRNKRKRKDNTSGITGVSIRDVGGNKLYYTVQWCDINGRVKQKWFSISKLGEETAKILAIAYRKEQIKQLIIDGADYTERHCT